MSKNIDIIECTLRDGSYFVDFKFTAKETSEIAFALQNAGFKYIEIGHGLGLNASKSKGRAIETDETYLKTAQEILNKSRYGMFFIPGIGRKKDLDLAAKYDMDFVRIGTNVTQVSEAKEYIKYAKDYGMITTSNLMKSYVLSPTKFAKKAKLAEQFGADIIEIVDSAGGMFPDDIKKYIKSMKKEEINVRIGFHGHDNLSLAMANTLEAINNGATIVDSTLAGIGRSSGNTITEILIAVLKKKGYNLNIDMFKTIEISEKLIKPKMKLFDKINSINIISGYADFHSSFLNIIYKVSKKYFIQPEKLIIAVCKENKINLTEDIAIKIAKNLKNDIKISVIMRTHNSEKFIKKALDNLLNQTLEKKYYEILVIDDKSKDKTKEILRNYGNKINFIEGKKSSAVKNLNIGIKNAKGNYIIIMDCDDTYQSSILKEMLNNIGDNDFIYCDYYEYNEKNNVEMLISLKENIFNSIAGGILFKKKMLEDIGLYDEKLIFPEYDVLTKIIKKYKGLYIPKPLFTYLRHNNSITSNKKIVKKGFYQLKKRYDMIHIRNY